MAGIKAPIVDVLAKLRTLLVKNGDGNMVIPHVRVWNNQLQSIQEGKDYTFPMPAMFVEVVTPVTMELIGQGMAAADVDFRIHILHEHYDAQDGTFEQDLEVFDLRDKVIALLSGYRPTGCGGLDRVSEQQDYDHNNIYHYIVDFLTNFIDSKGSPLDNDSVKYIIKTPPTNLELHTTKAQGSGEVKISTFVVNQ